MSASQFASFDDFQAKSGIKFPDGDESATKRHARYIGRPKKPIPQPRLKRDNDGEWEVLTPTPPTSEASIRFGLSSSVSTSCLPRWARGHRDSLAEYTGPSLAQAESRSRSKVCGFLGLTKGGVDPDLTQATLEANSVKASSNGSYTCPRTGCRIVAEDSDDLVYHLRGHIIREPKICPRCKAQFQRAQDIDAHRCRKRGMSFNTPFATIRRVFHL